MFLYCMQLKNIHVLFTYTIHYTIYFYLSGLNVNKYFIILGELSVEERIQVLDRFRDGLEKILITTNVMARGIDIEQVTIVVNYDLPLDASGKPDCETYLHRIGRTGRFGKHGLGTVLNK